MSIWGSCFAGWFLGFELALSARQIVGWNDFLFGRSFRSLGRIRILFLFRDFCIDRRSFLHNLLLCSFVRIRWKILWHCRYFARYFGKWYRKLGDLDLWKNRCNVLIHVQGFVWNMLCSLLDILGCCRLLCWALGFWIFFPWSFCFEGYEKSHVFFCIKGDSWFQYDYLAFLGRGDLKSLNLLN